MIASEDFILMKHMQHKLGLNTFSFLDALNNTIYNMSYNKWKL